MFGVWGSRFRGQGLGFRVQGLGVGVEVQTGSARRRPLRHLVDGFG